LRLGGPDLFWAPLSARLPTFQVADAPGEREIMIAVAVAVAVAVADGGRPLARLAALATAVEPGQTV
jgi:hypothetical protein